MSQSNPTSKQAMLYAESFVIYGEEARAFKAAFPDSKAKKNALYVAACRLHKHPKIQLSIERLREISKKQSEEEFCLSASHLKKKLSVAIDKGLEDKTIVSDGVEFSGGAVSISGAVSAIAEVNKMDGNYAATRIALGGDANNPVKVDMKRELTREELEAECKKRGLPMMDLGG